MSDTPGDVLTLGGRRYGKTASLEQTFAVACEAAVARDGRDSVYAVIGPDSSDGFRRRVEAICPTIVDEGARGVALILAGTPDEWEGLDDAP